ncbi:MAG: DUF2950 domain-containing protein [Steroidobacteraceae bacterium]
MRRVKSRAVRAGRALLLGLGAATLFLTTGFGLGATSLAQQPGQRTFGSPADAVSALFTAVRSNDERAILAVLGPAGKRVVSSGDATEDAAARANFVRKYDQMHRLVKEPDGTLTLYVGAENWPMPIPIAQSGRAWYFDTASGAREILYRRIGRNELSAIRVCEALAAGEKEYGSTHHGEYARHIFSTSGRHDGLYWKVDRGEPGSPIGPLVASAAAEGYAAGRHKGTPTPYRGYYYHILTRQGGSARGGARSYLAGDRMTGGFAFVAYPAVYRSSGVMTFIVGGDGVVYQKDLGRRTDVIARAMKEYNPGPGWQQPR